MKSQGMKIREENKKGGGGERGEKKKERERKRKEKEGKERKKKKKKKRKRKEKEKGAMRFLSSFFLFGLAFIPFNDSSIYLSNKDKIK